MKKELFQEIEIPEGVEVKLDGDVLSVKGPEGENKREFRIINLDFKIKDGKIVIGNKKATKTEKRMMNTIASHVRNMIAGVQEKYVYTLKVVFNHFPITVNISGNKAEITNFLGEKVPRTVEIPEGAEAKLDNDIITVSSVDKELAGQAAANFEMATKIPLKDRRTFQDGIYITSKGGKEI